MEKNIHISACKLPDQSTMIRICWCVLGEQVLSRTVWTK